MSSSLSFFKIFSKLLSEVILIQPNLTKMLVFYVLSMDKAGSKVLEGALFSSPPLRGRQKTSAKELGGTFMLEKIFHLKENRTDVKTELMAGITTFMTMAYILAVNPSILSASGVTESGRHDDRRPVPAGCRVQPPDVCADRSVHPQVHSAVTLTAAKKTPVRQCRDSIKQYFDLITKTQNCWLNQLRSSGFSVVCESKNHPVATNFQFLKISCPFGTASCWGVPAPNPARNEYDKLEFTN